MVKKNSVNFIDIFLRRVPVGLRPAKKIAGTGTNRCAQPWKRSRIVSGIDHQGSMPDVDVGVKPRSGVDVDGCGSMWGVVYVTCQRDTRPLRSHAADGPGRKEEEDETRERGRKRERERVCVCVYSVCVMPVYSLLT